MYRLYVKRILDILFSLIFLPFVGVIILILSPLIYISDQGPVFYNAIRIGKDFKEFRMYKFRTMRVNAPDLRNPDGSTFNADDDERVTKIGRILRKTSMDELPQILNVLIGDMSFVGPRPILPQDFSLFTERMRLRMSIRPGLTGYNQAFYRNSVSRMQKYENDAFYTENISFMFDVKIILMTILTVIRRKNINKN
jgi:undecaprenyl phosphate N,N'-diacetylbacillosamine 1-phosphate transferase